MSSIESSSKLIFPAIFTVAGGYLAGTNAAFNLIGVPAILASADPLPTWKLGYTNGRNSALTCISVITATGLKCYFDSNADTRYLIVAGLAAAIPPYTLLFLKPINDALFAVKEEEKAKADERIRGLIGKWGNIHLGRSLLSGAAFLISVSIIMSRK